MLGYGSYYPTEGEVGTGDVKPQVRLEFTNSKENGLGIPLPKGKIKIYQRDKSGSVQMLGEDQIDHTPKDETIKLKIGNAFDVVCERNQTGFRKISSNVYELEYEIALRNHKGVPITVEVNEPIGGTWQMLSASHQWTKTAAWAAHFEVPVAPEGSSTLKYRVLVTY